MKLFVDKMPEKGEDCLFNKRSEHHGDYWICMLTGRTCSGKPVCHHLKEGHGSSFLEPRFANEKELKDVKNNKIDPCLCGSKDQMICMTGNPHASLYFIKCNACDYESEQFPSIEEAILYWNNNGKDKHIYTPYIYQIEATRTADPKLSAEKKILEGLVGMNSEAGEALDIWKKYEFHKHDLDVKAIALELGDVLWYLTEAAVALGYSLEDIMKMNIEKLSKRYPEGFDPERSKNREA